MIVEPKVTLIAYTRLAGDPDPLGPGKRLEDWMNLDPDATDAENLTEFSGRACYESFDKPNPATRKNADYLTRTIFEQGHGSIAEHATATVYLEGVSRAFLAELSRHRHLSFSVLSQRFVDESEANIVLPPAIREHGGSGHLEQVAHDLGDDYTHLVEYLVNAGLKRKQAREAARAVLPNMTETRMVVTGNLRAWQQTIERRTAPDADAEMREVMGMVNDALYEVSPVIFPKVDA